MIGLGILEIALITGAGYYILSHFSKKKRIQYIEINQQQFDQLQDSLIINNILPTDINSNNFYNRLQQIPPSYQETTGNLPPVPPYQSAGPPELYRVTEGPAILEASSLNNPLPELANQETIPETNYMEQPGQSETALTGSI